MPIFNQIGIIIIFAAIFAYVAKLIKQPLIIAYLLVGIIIGPIGLNLVHNQAGIETMASIGIAFLLFIVGLELNFAKLKKLGSTVIIIALFQILATFFLAFLLTKAFSYELIPSIYLSLALTFGSTVIVVKLLSEKRIIDHLHGKIALGILLIQDIVAVIALVFLNNMATTSDANIAMTTVSTILKVAAIVIAIWLLGNLITTFFFKKIAKNPDVLFIIAIAWCFFGAIFADMLGLSIEIGAFIAGVSIASSAYTIEITSKIKPLRDFFVIIFFVILGLSLNFTNIGNWWIIGAFCLFVFIFHPLTTMIIMGVTGFKKRTSFLTGLSIAQISEFALILAALGLKLGHIDQQIVTTITVVAIITIIVSTYLITYESKIYYFLSPILKIFESKDIQFDESAKKIDKFQDHIILLGARRTGFNILKTLKKLRKNILVVDFNPELAEELIQKNIPVIYGDITDDETIHALNIPKADIFISTIPEYEDNIITIKKIKKLNKNILYITTAIDVEEAYDFYKKGADYVILPHQLSGIQISGVLEKTDTKTHAKSLRKAHIKELKDHIKEHGNLH